MGLIEAIILGLVQGLTEFIPVSSSGHLVLFHELFGDGDDSLAFDVALHLGTLFALLVIFYKDLINLLKGMFTDSVQKKLATLLIIGTIPAAMAGYFLESAAETTFRSPLIVALSLIAVALAMLIAEHLAKRQRIRQVIENISGKQALGIGIAQAVAIIPGVSRSGSTITAGLFLGLDRVAATRFSFLLAIPIIAGAVLKVATSGDTLSTVGDESGIFIAGMVSAFISGVFAIRFLLRYLANHTLNIFAYYRIILGLVVLAALFI